MAAFAARAAQGHIGRARRLATDEGARLRRKGASAAAAAGRHRQLPHRRREPRGGRPGGGPGGDGAALDATRDRGAGPCARRRHDRQGHAARCRRRSSRTWSGSRKRRATRTQRDVLDRALVDLASFYRDVLACRAAPTVELVNAELRTRGRSSGPLAQQTLRRMDAMLACREAIEANVAPLLAVERCASAADAVTLGSGCRTVRSGCTSCACGAGLGSARVGMVMAVSFNRYGRLYYLDPGELTPAGRRQGAGAHRRRPRGGRVRVGRAVGQRGHRRLPACCAGLAGDDDLRRDEAQRKRKAEAQGRREAADPRARPADEGRRGRPRARAAPDGARTTIYFTAPHRVDFRSLVRDLGATLHCRVELRQLSAPATRRGCRAASARAVVTCAARPSSPTSSRSPSGWPRTRTCRSTRCGSPAPAGG